MDLGGVQSYKQTMGQHSLADAKDRLSELIDRAHQGEDVVITRNGAPVAEIRPVDERPLENARPVSKEALDWLDANRVGTKIPSEDAGTLLSRLRDESEH